MGFSRQEHWSGLPFPSPMHESGKWKVKVKSLSRVWLLATTWTAAYQAPPSMGFSRQQYWSGMPLPSLSQLPTLSLTTGLEFNLFVTERKGMTLEVMTQPWGPHQQPIAYLSRKLDIVAWSRPHCLRVITAIALLVLEALKSNDGWNLYWFLMMWIEF